METLNLSGSSARNESRLKSLFWPPIENGSDVDYLGAQGYWVCTLVAVFSVVFLANSGKPATGAAILLFYYLGGVGVRERSRYAAVVVFAMYLLDPLISPGVVRILFAALLLSNLRATWIASGWGSGSEEALLPPRLHESVVEQISRHISRLALAEDQDCLLYFFRNLPHPRDLRVVYDAARQNPRLGCPTLAVHSSAGSQENAERHRAKI